MDKRKAPASAQTRADAPAAANASVDASVDDSVDDPETVPPNVPAEDRAPATGDPAIVLVNPVQRHGLPFKAAVRDMGFAVVSVYTMADIDDMAGHDKGDDVTLYSRDAETAARLVAATGFDIKAVIPALEAGTDVADTIAARLGLPGNDPTLAWARRNKAAMRARAVETGVRVPAFRLVRSEDEIASAVEEIGFPAIVKPTMGACSQGVTVLPDAAALRALTGRLVTHDVYKEPVTEWLVERYVRGHEYCVNFFSVDGEHRLVDIWEYRQPDDRDYDFPLWDIVQLDESHPDRTRIDRTVRSVLDAYGVQRGPSHTEVKVDESGVYLMEIGARLPGGPTVTLWSRHGVLRPFHDTLACFLGERPPLMDQSLTFPGVFGSAVIRNDNRPGTLVALHGLDKVAALPGVDDLWVSYEPGQHVPVTENNTTVPFSATAVGPTTPDVLDLLSNVRSLVTLEMAYDPTEAPRSTAH